MDPSKAVGYKNSTQQAKNVTEDWVRTALYCLSCGRQDLVHPIRHDEPVLDFVCSGCLEEYELKASRQRFGGSVVNGAYDKVVNKISAGNNPSFLFLQYKYPAWMVRSLFALPRHVFFPDAIRKHRKPLPERRAYFLSDILLNRLPLWARVQVVMDGVVVPQPEVLNRWNTLSNLRQIQPSLRGWTLHIWNLIMGLGKTDFTTADAYRFQEKLNSIYPGNRHVKEKIRQQLQYLRNAGFIEFKGKGNYRVTQATTQLRLDPWNTGYSKSQ